MSKRCTRCGVETYGEPTECPNCGLLLEVIDETAMIRNTWKPMGYEE